MLDFDGATYKKILDIAIKNNITANCREYPSLLLCAEETNLKKIRKALVMNLDDPHYKCGLYVHFPFCNSRCLFCKYYSELKIDDRQFDDFLTAFEKEIEMYGIDFKAKEMENLFLGGGTPTLLDYSRMKKFLETIHGNFKFKISAQKTIEGTPESLTQDKIKLYKEYGIDRISIGLQSSNDHVLQRMGRKHTVRDVFKAFDIARKGGINCVATELIWGLPGETLESYKKTINDIISLSPDFIEGYLLTEGGRVKTSKYCPQNSDLDSIINMSKETLLSSGYRIYYSSNFLGFIKIGISREIAMNQNTDGLYNYYSDVLGTGPGASSHFHNYKYKIISHFESYNVALQNARFPISSGLNISMDDYKRHYIILQIGFFRSVEKKRYKEMFRTEFYEDFSKEIDCLKKKGIIIEDKNIYKWRLGEHEMGHRAFFMHIVQYWYNPKYIRQILKNWS